MLFFSEKDSFCMEKIIWARPLWAAHIIGVWESKSQVQNSYVKSLFMMIIEL